jgi:alkanesulfonate monooxygenase SsuD/methylene tetrahydromethanopterin reductase-like flavin-dependent oxidoreductase (luciferase family)
MTRPFRFGLVAPIMTDLPTWRDRVRRIADLGYSTLLMPDVPGMQPSPGPTLATAAAIADIRVGSWVYAAALRQPWSTAWEAHSLTTLTEGRFELGIGLGRTGIETEQGLPKVPGAERLARVRETVTALREIEEPDRHTPVIMAVRGPRSLALAAELADSATFVLNASDERARITHAVREFAASVDASGRIMELSQHVGMVGDVPAPFMGPPGIDPEALRAMDSLFSLPDDPAAVIDELLRRREEIGFSYFVFGAGFAERFAPVLARLSGA